MRAPPAASISRREPSTASRVNSRARCRKPGSAPLLKRTAHGKARQLASGTAASTPKRSAERASIRADTSRRSSSSADSPCAPALALIGGRFVNPLQDRFVAAIRMRVTWARWAVSSRATAGSSSRPNHPAIRWPPRQRFHGVGGGLPFEKSVIDQQVDGSASQCGLTRWELASECSGNGKQSQP